jgi:apolipoprotein D and lipocalin family protein
MMAKRALLVMVWCVVVWCLASPVFTAQPARLKVVADLDYARYVGTWYEIARLPNRFEDKCVGDITASYKVREDGRLDVTNRCKVAGGAYEDANGIARPVEGQPPSVLKVRFAPAFLSFLPMVWGDYQVIALGAQYEYAVVGTPDRKYLWVLARQADMDARLYQSAIDAAQAQGFDTSALIKPPHTKN